MRAGSQRGEGKLGFIITLTIFVVGVFVGFKVLPVRINAYQFRDALRDQARFASVNHNADNSVRQHILEEAQDLKIPLKPENIKITRTRKEVIVSARFEQEIDLKVMSYTYRFNGEERAPVF